MDKYLSHLRSIHFVMVITPLAIFLTLSNKDMNYETAMQQLRDISSLSETVDNYKMTDIAKLSTSLKKGVEEFGDDSYLQEKLKILFEEYLEDLSLDFEDTRISVSTHDLYTEEEYEYWEKKHQWFEQRASLLGSDKEYYHHPKRMHQTGKTLEEKQKQIETVIAAKYVFSNPSYEAGHSAQIDFKINDISDDLEDRLYDAKILSISLYLKSIKLTDQASRISYEDCVLAAEEDPEAYNNFEGKFDILNYECYIEYEKDGKNLKHSVKLPFPVMFTKSENPYFAELIKGLETGDEVYPRYRSGAKDCESLFPELFKLAKNFKDMNYSHLERVMNELHKKQGPSVNILGMSITLDKIGNWGVSLLLIVQLYFCLHYYAFVNSMKSKEELNFPWIGLYSSNETRIIFLLSCLLPVSACLYLTYGRDAYFLLTFISLAMYIAFVVFYIKFLNFKEPKEEAIIKSSYPG